jgi:hypothetical protein
MRAWRDDEKTNKEIEREIRSKRNEERKRKSSASSASTSSSSCSSSSFSFSSSSYPSRWVIVEFGRKTRMDCSLMYITHVIQTTISPYLPRIGHSDAPVPPFCDILDDCHSSYCLQRTLL